MSDAKSYLYRSICQPTLMYGLDAINLSAPLLKKLQNTQGSIMKESVAFRNVHTTRSYCVPLTSLMLIAS